MIQLELRKAKIVLPKAVKMPPTGGGGVVHVSLL